MSRAINSEHNGLRFLFEELRSIKKEFFSYFFLFIQFVYFSGLVRQFGTDEFLIFNILFSAFICVLKERITRRGFKVILISIIIFSVINLVPSFVFGFNIRLFAGYLGRIFLGYLIILYFNNEFYEKFENLVTILALISLPLYLIQIFYQDFFHFFDSLSNAVLSEQRSKQTGSNIMGHKYLFVFLYNGWATLRNSGFMWEPAAFGAMLTWAAILNILRNNFVMNSRLYILLLTAFTTFSLGTYIYLAGIFSLLSLKNKKLTFPKLMFLLSILILIGSQLNLVNENLEMMRAKVKAEERHRERALTGTAEETEISRVAAFELNINYFLNWPFGYGLAAEDIPDAKYLGRSPNGLMKILVTWGIFGILLVVCSVVKLLKYNMDFYQNNIHWLFRLGLLFLFIIPISGNPFYNQPLLFSLIFGIWVLRPNLDYSKYSSVSERLIK
jgi:hypothetical protein